MNPQVFTSFADVVDDTYDPELDGYDAESVASRTSIIARLTNPFHAAGALLQSTPTPTIVVPYIPVKEGDHDRDAVYAVKRAFARSKGKGRLRKLQSKPIAVRKRWGSDFSKEFGAKSYTQVRHQKLAPYYDAYALSLLHADQQRTSPRDTQIATQMGWHSALYNRRMQVAYSQIRPSQLGAASGITRADCSGSVAGGCAWAKILPHVDWRYTNTWVQITFGTSVPDVAHAVPGDVFLYGSPSHEALYLGDGLVWSFGSYPIKILRHDYRHDRRDIRRFVPL